MSNSPEHADEHTDPALGDVPYDAAAGAAIAESELTALDPRVRVVWTIGGVVTACVLGAATIGLELIWRDEEGSWPLPPMVLPGIATVVFLAWGFVYAQLRYRTWRYAVRPHDLFVRFGVIWRMRRCVPRLRIQHVDIEAGPIDRALGLTRLSVFTAGTIAAVATIPGLPPDRAEELRQILLAQETPRE